MTRTVALLCAILLAAPAKMPLWADETPAAAPADQTASAPAPAAPQSPPLSEDQLKSLVAPIALYPDELLSQILVASTYPLEVVQAYQWLQQHPDLKGQDLTQAAAQQAWDPSVQALVVFPDVMKRMNQDVAWMTNLGNAFLANQAGVMDTVQKLRLNAEQAGKLASSDQAKVVNTTEEGQPVVEIQPANPQVVYVPEYDPAWIWGPAPIYYPYPVWYYRPAPPIGVWWWWGPPLWFSTFYIGVGGWHGWGWRPGWYNHTVIVNNVFIRQNNFHMTHITVARGGTAVWMHDPVHRLGVAYPNRSLAQRYSPASVHWRSDAAPEAFHAASGHLTATQVQGQLRESATRVRAAAPMTDRIGSRQISSSGYNQNRSAFGGIGQGQTARNYSHRGYSSLNRTKSYVRPGGASQGGSKGGGQSSGGHGDGSGGQQQQGGWGGGHH